MKRLPFTSMVLLAGVCAAFVAPVVARRDCEDHVPHCWLKKDGLRRMSNPAGSGSRIKVLRTSVFQA
jgi:hypothetical protein